MHGESAVEDFNIRAGHNVFALNKQTGNAPCGSKANSEKRISKGRTGSWFLVILLSSHCAAARKQPTERPTGLFQTVTSGQFMLGKSQSYFTPIVINQIGPERADSRGKTR